MQRLYDNLVQMHFEEYRQMVFLVGPRQVGKTTISRLFNSNKNKLIYLNWDNEDDQMAILSGPEAIVSKYNL